METFIIAMNTYNTDDEIYRHHSSDIDLIEPSLDEPDTELDFWAPISRHNWTEEADKMY